MRPNRLRLRRGDHGSVEDRGLHRSFWRSCVDCQRIVREKFRGIGPRTRRERDSGRSFDRRNLRDVDSRWPLTTGFSPSTREALIDVLGWVTCLSFASHRPTPVGATGAGHVVVVRSEISDHLGEFVDGGR